MDVMDGIYAVWSAARFEVQVLGEELKPFVGFLF
jgi:hypothetical protein